MQPAWCTSFFWKAYMLFPDSIFSGYMETFTTSPQFKTLQTYRFFLGKVSFHGHGGCSDSKIPYIIRFSLAYQPIKISRYNPIWLGPATPSTAFFLATLASSRSQSHAQPCRQHTKVLHGLNCIRMSVRNISAL